MQREGLQQASLGQGEGPARPWHVWPVSMVAFFTYVMGAYDFVLTAALDPGYFSAQGYGPAAVAYFTDYPLVPRVLWTVNIAAGLLAPVLLLARSRRAAASAALAAAAQLLLLLATFSVMGRWSALGPFIAIFDVIIGLMTVGLWLYCRRMTARGVLR